MQTSSSFAAPRLAAVLFVFTSALACLAAIGVALLSAWRLVLLFVAVSLGGCAMLPSQVERPISHARADVQDTALARIAAASLAGDPDEQSAFRLLPDGAEALDARTALIRRAEKTLDIQYYLIADDETGRQFLGELQQAAARGVRVRLLVDDLYAAPGYPALADLAAHANVEVRLFNPLPVRSGSLARRIVLSMHEFSRINRRMHNKLMIADGSFAVTGGRNIADEYFDRAGESSFIDMDVLAAGPVVASLAAVFDSFWNSEVVYPVQSLVARAQPRAARVAADGKPPTRATRTNADDLPSPRTDSFDARLADSRIAFDLAGGEVLADDPRKARGELTATVAEAHLQLLAGAQSSVLLASPYVIPCRPTLAALSDMRARDVQVTLLTNSLATTDEPLVHLGYARHRASLLDAGVVLHELRSPSSSVAASKATIDTAGSSHSLGRLHTKVTVVDERKAFVGSMNMDPRSARLNTEIGIVVHSEVVAARVAAFVQQHRQEGSFTVVRRDAAIGWRFGDGQAQTTRSEEPRAPQMPSRLIRLLAQILGDGML